MVASRHIPDRRRALPGASPVSAVPVSVRLAADDGDDADRLRWVRLLAEAPFAYGKQVWNLTAGRTRPRDLEFRWSDVSASLRAQPERFAAAVTLEHRRDGTGLGTVQRVVELTRKQAAAHGIRQRERRALYAGLRLTDPAAREAYDSGRVQYVSPALSANLSTDEPGHVAPIWLDELSFVTVPHLRGQPNVADHMRSVQLKSGATMETHDKILAALADKLAECGVDADKAKQVLDFMSESMGMEEELEHEELEQKAEEAEKLEEAEEAELADYASCGTDEFAKQLAAMRAEMAALKAQLSAQRASAVTARVDADTAKLSVTTDAKAALAKLAASDEGAYKALLSSLPAKSASFRPLPTSRPAATGPAVAEKSALAFGADFLALDEDGQDRAITALMSAKGVEYTDAANWCQFGRMPARLAGLVASGLATVKD
jgi:hypothetical protein